MAITKMNNATTRFFLALPAIVFIGSEAIRTFVRPVYGKSQYGWASDILGWLPNFLAAFGCMTFGLAFVLLMRAATTIEIRPGRKLLLLGAVAAVTLAGLILHEIFQTGTGLHYDPNDIMATVAGVICGAALYMLVLRRPDSRSMTTSSRNL
ncbi:hypothetical protein [Flavobacterium selenitireducens]|uniref:hypothetical protein n=1 Tax=Flavobacterium selenitireducens TaxID=2722704 RepID=UPI00168BB99C|nr:hypothetical protein [Flavobacterium selenitireducens]MBD3581267.1 hypothetical protein [Flavobacterium selenitireducens]